MKKITVEYESQDELNYDLELQAKGMAFDQFDEHLRQILKYGGVEDIYTDILESHKSDHKTYFGSERFKAATKKQIVELMVEYMRTKMNSFVSE